MLGTEGDGAGAAAFGNAVVDEFEVDLFVLLSRPSEKQPRHACIGFDVVMQKVVDSLIAPELLASGPGAHDGRLRRRDHEKHIDHMAEAREEPAPILLACRKTIKAKAVDKKVR